MDVKATSNEKQGTKEMVVLVDEHDKEIGTEEKIKAHENGGQLHRAFSVFIFNDKGELLLQQRAKGKYHCADLWTNTCCSHPRPDETAEKAAHRKLKQEMGFDTGLKEILTFTYRAPFDNGLTEHEYDHVFVGKHNEDPHPNPEEAGAFKWINLDELEKGVSEHPEKYTPWFKIILARVLEWYRENKDSM